MNNDNFLSRNYIFLIVLSAFFISSFVSSSVYVGLPSIEIDFGMDAISLAWVSTSLLLSTAMFLVPFGKLADIYGRKKVFFYGIMIYTAASVLSGVSNSGFLLIVFQFLQGLGAAMFVGTGIAILASECSEIERGKILGFYVATIYLGLSLGPLLGGSLIFAFGWRSIFLTSIPFGVAIITLIFSKLKADYIESKQEDFDFVGAIIYALTVFAVIYAFSLFPDSSGIWLLLVGFLGILVFLIWENRQTSPIINIGKIIHNSDFAFSNASTLIHYCATASITFLLSFYLQYIKGNNPLQSGMILVAQPIIQTILSPFVGRVSDKFNPRKIASLGMSIEAIGLFLFSFISENTTTEFIVANLLFVGLGYALFSSPNANAIISSIDKKSYGTASATRETMLHLGTVVGMAITMLVLATYVGRVQITPYQYPLFLMSAKVAFIIFSAICLTGVIFQSLGIRKLVKRNQ